MFHIGVEKVPIVGNKGNIIKRYEYSSYIQFLDILSDQITENPNKLHERIDLFLKNIRADVARNDHSE